MPEGMASGDSSEAQPAPSENAPFVDRLNEVVAAGGIKLAPADEQWPERDLVAADEELNGEGRYAANRSQPTARGNGPLQRRCHVGIVAPTGGLSPFRNFREAENSKMGTVPLGPAPAQETVPISEAHGYC